jgi:hypothetical protein
MRYCPKTGTCPGTDRNGQIKTTPGEGSYKRKANGSGTDDVELGDLAVKRLAGDG